MTDTDFANYSLNNIGVPSIDDIDDTSDEAEICKLYIPVARQTFLRQSKLAMSRKEASLATPAGESSYVYDYVYTLPADCLSPIRIHNWSSDNVKIDYEVGINSAKNGLVIKTDYSDTTNGVILIYSTDITNLTLYKMDAIIAMSYLHSALIAPSLKRDSNMVKDMENKYLVALSIVKANDKNNQHINVVNNGQYTAIKDSRNST